MRPAAREAFVPFTVSLEGGYIVHMFPDVYKLISTGFGLLLDPIDLALGLEWLKPDGAPATKAEVAAQWSSLKNFIEANPGCEKWSWKRFADKTTIRLSRAGLDKAFQRKIAGNLATLITGFPDFESWSADAQLGALSMAWAVGPGYWSPNAGRRYFPKLTAALRARDYKVAAKECFLDEEAENPGIIPRNDANKILFGNADIIERTGLDPAVLHWPRDLTKPVDREAETMKDLSRLADSEPPSAPTRIIHPWHFVEPGDDEPPPAAA